MAGPKTSSSTAKGRRSGLRAEAARTFNACQACRNKKVKCSGQQPCSYCEKRNHDCVFEQTDRRRMFSLSQVRELRDKIAYYEKQQPQSDESGDICAPCSPTSISTAAKVATAQPLDAQHQEQNAIRHDQNQLTPQTTTPIDPLRQTSTTVPSLEALAKVSVSVQAQPPFEGPCSSLGLKTAPTSSENFSSEVRTLLTARSNPGSANSVFASSHGLSPTLLADCRDLIASQDWPSEDEAYAMLEVTVHHVGISQQLFDAREFSNKLCLMYQDSAHVQNTHFSELWMIQVLLVFAIGRLLLAKPDEDGNLPGTGFYEEARKRMPDMGHLLRQGALGVEVVGLAGMYLQIADRKEEAYVYASMALRLAISNGFHRSSNASSRLRPTTVYQNRLWWSLYMQERRLCAAGGYPMSIGDHAISTPAPYDAASYPSATAMAINVRTAQVMGEIARFMYENKEDTETVFINKVSEVLRSLHEIESRMPAEFSVKFSPGDLVIAGVPFSDSNHDTARTSSSLYISVYSTIIYAVRPILLYMARESPGREASEQHHRSVSPALRRLAEICVEAASKTLVILQHLRKRDLVAKHAFLDLDAAFSVGFIFVLVEAINPTKGLGVDGIEGARSVLGHQAIQGNRAASKRLDELDSMCLSLSLPVQPRQVMGLHYQTSPQTASLLTEVLMQPFSFDSGFNTTHHMDFPMDSSIRETAQSAHVSNQAPADQSYDHLGMDLADLASIPLEGENDLYWVYHDPNIPFTGVEQLDWGALEGQLPHEPT